MKLVLTGTPGTGKTTLGKALASKLGSEFIDLNKLAEEKSLYTGKVDKGAKEVKLGELKKELLKKIKNNAGYVIEGHLACEFFVPCEKVIVLRTNPLVLLKRMKERSYSREKMRDNLLCEILDYCLIKAELNYPHTQIIQINTTKKITLKSFLEKIKSGKSDKVDWSKMLLKNKKVQEFLRE